MKGTLNLILALPAEASPIIRYFNLQLIISEPYKIYTNHDNSIRLVLSGIGKLHANKAVSNIEKESGAKITRKVPQRLQRHPKVQPCFLCKIS